MSIREQLLALLEEMADDRVTRFVWLRQFEPGSNSSSANRLLDRLEYLQRVDLPEDLLAGVPAHRVTRLRRQGERYYADGMRDLPEDRRLAILAVCVSEWQAMLADAVVETHDRIVGRLLRQPCGLRHDLAEANLEKGVDGDVGFRHRRSAGLRPDPRARLRAGLSGQGLGRDTGAADGAVPTVATAIVAEALIAAAADEARTAPRAGTCAPRCCCSSPRSRCTATS